MHVQLRLRTGKCTVPQAGYHPVGSKASQQGRAGRQAGGATGMAVVVAPWHSCSSISIPYFHHGAFNWVRITESYKMKNQQWSIEESSELQRRTRSSNHRNLLTQISKQRRRNPWPTCNNFKYFIIAHQDRQGFCLVGCLYRGDATLPSVFRCQKFVRLDCAKAAAAINVCLDRKRFMCKCCWEPWFWELFVLSSQPGFVRGWRGRYVGVADRGREYCVPFPKYRTQHEP